MNRLNNLALSLIASSIFLINNPINASAQASPPSGEPGAVNEESVKIDCPMACEPWSEKLGLTDEQMEKLVSLKSDYEIKTAEKKAQLMADTKQMMLLMTASKTDKDAVLTLNEKMNSLKTELATARVNKMLDAMAVMTVKQREEIHHHMLTHMLSHHNMHEMHHHIGEHHH